MIDKRVYFDNAATTALNPKALDKMLPYLNEYYGNASSIHSYGRKARVAIEEAREVIAGSINANPGEIYFVSGGTEANNFPILGISRLNRFETKRKNIITSKAEHVCVLESIEELAKEGFKTIKAKVNSDSILEDEELINLADNNTSIVSAIHVNNETSAINNIKELCKISHTLGAYFHTDAVQSFGKIKIDVKDLSVDALSIAGHKINGPKGVGAVYIKSGTPASPIIYGGSQERNRRGGTENVAAIVGFAEAVKDAADKMDDNFVKVSKIRNFIINGIKHIDPAGIKINCEDSPFPFILSFTLSSKTYNNDAEAMLMYLDINGIAASNGAACSSGTLKPSHVILSMGTEIEDSKGTLRLSFGAQNTMAEAEYFLEVFSIMARKFRV